MPAVVTSQIANVNVDGETSEIVNVSSDAVTSQIENACSDADNVQRVPSQIVNFSNCTISL